MFPMSFATMTLQTKWPTIYNNILIIGDFVYKKGNLRTFIFLTFCEEIMILQRLKFLYLLTSFLYSLAIELNSVIFYEE